MNNRTIIDNYYRLHRDELLSFVSSRLRGSDRSEDIVQDAFLRLLQVKEPIIENTLPNLAFTYCKRLIIDHYRHKANSMELGMECMELATCNHTATANSTPCTLHPARSDADSRLLLHELTAHVENSLSRLSEESRALYRLHIYDGMKAAEICQFTGLQYRSVEYQLGLARKQIRNYLRKIS